MKKKKREKHINIKDKYHLDILIEFYLFMYIYVYFFSILYVCIVKIIHYINNCIMYFFVYFNFYTHDIYIIIIGCIFTKLLQLILKFKL